MGCWSEGSSYCRCRTPFGVYTFTAPTSVCERQTNPSRFLFARRVDCNVKRSPGAKEARSTAQAGRKEPKRFSPQGEWIATLTQTPWPTIAHKKSWEGMDVCPFPVEKFGGCSAGILHQTSGLPVRVRPGPKGPRSSRVEQQVKTRTLYVNCRHKNSRAADRGYFYGAGVLAERPSDSLTQACAAQASPWSPLPS